MKKIIINVIMIICILVLTSCDNDNITGEKEITCEDIIQVYEEAGYEIFHKETTEQDYDW